MKELATKLDQYNLENKHTNSLLKYSKNMVKHMMQTNMDGLVQERRSSIANALELLFLALTHRYDLQTSFHLQQLNM